MGFDHAQEEQNIIKIIKIVQQNVNIQYQKPSTWSTWCVSIESSIINRHAFNHEFLKHIFWWIFKIQEYNVLWFVIPCHLMCGVSYFDFICIGLEANQMPKKGAFGYNIKYTKMNEWSKEDSSPYSDLRGHISLVSTYIDWSCNIRTWTLKVF